MKDLKTANEETGMAIDDYRLYNRMVDLTSKEVETSEAIVILGLNQEQADEYEKLLQGVIEERKKYPNSLHYEHAMKFIREQEANEATEKFWKEK